MKLKYLWYRIRQFGFSAFMYLAPVREAKLIVGAGSIYKIPKLLKKDGYIDVVYATNHITRRIYINNEKCFDRKEEYIK